MQTAKCTPVLEVGKEVLLLIFSIESILEHVWMQLVYVYFQIRDRHNLNSNVFWFSFVIQVALQRDWFSEFIV